MSTIKINTGIVIKTFVFPTGIDNRDVRNQVLKCLKACCNDYKTIAEMNRFLKKIRNDELERYLNSGDIIISVMQNKEEMYYIYSGILCYTNTL